MKDTKYYKLISKYPNHKLGDIVTFDSDISDTNFYWMDESNEKNIYELVPKEFRPDVTPDWFELCLFVTEDGVPIFKGQKYFHILKNNLIDSYIALSKRDEYMNESSDLKYFSSNTSAENYLKDMKYNGIKFRRIVCLDATTNIANHKPSYYDNIEYIGFDRYYGDVFKCYQNDKMNDFTLYFGTKS